jgi:hypothetical protein
MREAHHGRYIAPVSKQPDDIFRGFEELDQDSRPRVRGGFILL